MSGTLKKTAIIRVSSQIRGWRGLAYRRIVMGEITRHLTRPTTQRRMALAYLTAWKQRGRV